MGFPSGSPSSPPGAPPELELDIRPVRSHAPRPRTTPPAEVALELAVDPRALVRERAEGTSMAPQPIAASVFSEHPPAGHTSTRPASTSLRVPVAEEVDLALDARLLADCGDPPQSLVRSPLYAYRVLVRLRELRTALRGRREEAKHAAAEAESALVEVAEIARATAEKTTTYTQAIEDLRRVEDELRSRDQVLAHEQDGQKARLALLDARLVKLEVDLEHLERDERAVRARMIQAQATLVATRLPDASVSPEEKVNVEANAEASAHAQSQLHAAASNRVAEARAKVEAARDERSSLHHWFERQVGTRTAAVEGARAQVRQSLLTIARRALADPATFGGELDGMRERVATLEGASRAAARDVLVHEAALGSHDERALRRGVLTAVILVLLLIVGPIVWRAVRVVDPPPPAAQVIGDR
jgi:hypothetical protein